MIDQISCQGSANHPEAIADLRPVRLSNIVSGPGDAMLLLAEWGFRQIYWRSALVRRVTNRFRAGKVWNPCIVHKQKLADYLTSIGVKSGALVMAHTSLSGMTFDQKTTANSESPNSIHVARELLALLLDLVGESGTLVMPTHPVDKARRAVSSAGDSPAIPVFNPQSTPCGVGLANELFWRQPGTQRSLFPHNTLAARGKLATELLRNNLTDDKPLPHGVQSGYYRFCQRNGLLVSIGIPLGSCFTLVHAAEDARDERWTVPNFFEERRYILRHEGHDRNVTIRKTRAEFMKFSLCIRKLRRDLVRAGILHEGYVGDVRVDWAHSLDVFQFISQRNQSTSYPYFGTSFVMRKDLENPGHA